MSSQGQIELSTISNGSTRSRRTKESVEVDDDLGRKRGGAGGMKDSQPGIIRHESRDTLRERLGTVRAAFRETLNPCPKALFVVEDEHMAFSYTNSWKLARSATSLALLKKSVRNGQGADKGLCQKLSGSIRVNHVTVHTPAVQHQRISTKEQTQDA